MDILIVVQILIDPKHDKPEARSYDWITCRDTNIDFTKDAIELDQTNVNEKLYIATAKIDPYDYIGTYNCDHGIGYFDVGAEKKEITDCKILCRKHTKSAVSNDDND